MDKPIKIYAEVLEELALSQFNAVMDLPDVVQGALMPDAHTGYVLPIGAVVATVGTIYPSFVGYDIGCGMSATQLNVDVSLIEQYAIDIRNEIYKILPVGFSKNNQQQEFLAKAACDSIALPHSEALSEKISYGPKCLGTLGGGNHFVEIGKDDKGFIWVVVHSGSRSVGHAVASYYMELAAKGEPVEQAHALISDSDEGKDYIQDMNYCLSFALKNRELISEIVIMAIYNVLKNKENNDAYINRMQFINKNHNHAELKNGRWIHRKGATHADAGMYGVIPGNMRDGSFIVIGKGNSESMNSSSHGAGRVLSRTQAKKNITLEQFQDSMKNILAATVDAKRIDESPFAYKNIFEVMNLQKDLIEVVTHISPIINVKG